MKIAGVITEYNPFHNGHKLHIEETRRLTGCNYIIAVMSGNFVQRGEPAVFSKWTRARAALESGADMVIELPVVYSTASAEFFAASAVRLLDDIGCVSHICFGSEHGSLDALSRIARILADEPEEYKARLKAGLDSGLPFHSARESAIAALLPVSEKILSSPNNILAVEYIKALIRLKSSIIPVTIERKTSGYSSMDIDGEHASATAIRSALLKNDFSALSAVPGICGELYRAAAESGEGPVCYEPYFSVMLGYRLRTEQKSYIKSIMDVSEGLENRILSALNSASSMQDIIEFVKSKRYTQTKIQRALLHIILGITKKDFTSFNACGMCQYARALGFRRTSSEIFKLIKENSSIPIIAGLKNADKLLDGIGAKMLDYDIKATDIYMSAVQNESRRAPGQDYTRPLIIIK